MNMNLEKKEHENLSKDLSKEHEELSKEHEKLSKDFSIHINSLSSEIDYVSEKMEHVSKYVIEEQVLRNSLSTEHAQALKNIEELKEYCYRSGTDEERIRELESKNRELEKENDVLKEKYSQLKRKLEKTKEEEWER